MEQVGTFLPCWGGWSVHIPEAGGRGSLAPPPHTGMPLINGKYLSMHYRSLLLNASLQEKKCDNS